VLAAAVALVVALLAPSEGPAPRQNQAAGGGVPQPVVASSSGIRIHSTG
jgi:hypothetical protein